MSTGAIKPERVRLLEQWGALKESRAPWFEHWQELARRIKPRTGQFLEGNDQMRGAKKHNEILDSEASHCVGIFRSNMMAGATPPDRPWIRYGIADEKLAADHSVKEWFAEVAKIVLYAIGESNTYDALSQVYQELAVFGTAAVIVEFDREKVLHCYPLTAGEFAIAQDDKGKVCTLFRECQMTVYQMVRKFGHDKCSHEVQRAHDDGRFEERHTVVHGIFPNPKHDPNKRSNRAMAYRSVYFELATNEDKLLRESGYRRFPAIVPRWDLVSSVDVYGNSCAMDALGDVNQVQFEHRLKAKGLAHMADPAKQVPIGAKNMQRNLNPGGVTFVPDGIGQGAQVREAVRVSIDVSAVTEDIEDARRRIRRCFFVDVFLMLTGIAERDKTAHEVRALEQEKRLVLAPLLTRLDRELLEPLTDLVYEFLLEGGGIPDVPPALQEIEYFRPEFLSVFAEAQKAVGITNVNAAVGDMLNIAERGKPEILDNLNVDALANIYQDKYSLEPKLFNPPEQVAALREARNRAQAAEAQILAMREQAATAKDLADSQTDQPSVLTQLNQLAVPA